MTDDLRYPIGRFSMPEEPVTSELRTRWMAELAACPAALRAAVSGLDARQLDTPYRPGGWTVRQVVHHVPDSHLNAYTRLKLALTEPEPTIKPYDEAAWARLPDVTDTPIDVSLTLLDALHDRWLRLLRTVDDAGWRRTFRHPEHGAVMSLDYLLGTYAWHGRHHVAHVTRLREREGW